MAAAILANPHSHHASFQAPAWSPHMDLRRMPSDRPSLPPISEIIPGWTPGPATSPITQGSPVGPVESASSEYAYSSSQKRKQPDDEREDRGLSQVPRIAHPSPPRRSFEPRHTGQFMPLVAQERDELRSVPPTESGISPVAAKREPAEYYPREVPALRRTQPEYHEYHTGRGAYPDRRGSEDHHQPGRPMFRELDYYPTAGPLRRGSPETYRAEAHVIAPVKTESRDYHRVGAPRPQMDERGYRVEQSPAPPSTQFRGEPAAYRGQPVQSYQPEYPPENQRYAYAAHPTHGQSLSMGSLPHSPQEPVQPIPFTFSRPYAMGRHSYVSAMEDGPQPTKKRRGNLPKEVTDILRRWFLAHLEHPYPNEEEKRMLQEQTGLQPNQISNWFINARRRQMPAITKDAQTHSNAMQNIPPPPPDRFDYDGRAGQETTQTGNGDLGRHGTSANDGNRPPSNPRRSI